MNKQRSTDPATWTTGAYATVQDLRLHFPPSLLLLAKVCGVTPEQLLTDFIDQLACGPWKRSGTDASRQHLQQYFLAQGYGQDRHAASAIAALLQDLSALGRLFPEGDPRLIALYETWRDAYLAHLERVILKR